MSAARRVARFRAHREKPHPLVQKSKFAREEDTSSSTRELDILILEESLEISLKETRRKSISSKRRVPRNPVLWRTYRTWERGEWMMRVMGDVIEGARRHVSDTAPATCPGTIGDALMPRLSILGSTRP